MKESKAAAKIAQILRTPDVVESRVWSEVVRICTAVYTTWRTKSSARRPFKVQYRISEIEFKSSDEHQKHGSISPICKLPVCMMSI
jgi:hypothetical protein